MKIGRIEIAPVLDGRILSKLPATKSFPGPESPLRLDRTGCSGPTA